MTCTGYKDTFITNVVSGTTKATVPPLTPNQHQFQFAKRKIGVGLELRKEQ